IDIEVFPSPNEVIARLANGELDMAALPTNVAANLYNKGVGIRLAAVIGNGMLSLISSKGSTDVEDLYGATLHLPGAGSTPAQMARLLVRWAGLTEGKDIFFDYSVAAPAQLAQLLIAGKVDYALLPQPFVSLVLNKSAQATLLLDVQELYAELTGSPTYPMSVLVVSETFASTYPVNLRKVLNAYKRSVDWVNGDPALAARRIEELGIMPKALAQSAIPHCNLVYVPASEAKDEVTFYFEQLHALDPASIGGRVPGSELYL
ncbi:MAG: ABC transporter substrate-binding protein, partial [Spirochaetales bacterium]|nr:ABC transporter substrate-binding protein [Spirochaetales bacterium]